MLKDMILNWVLIVRRRRCELLFDCIQTERINGVNINWKHYEKVMVARNGHVVKNKFEITCKNEISFIDLP